MAARRTAGIARAVNCEIFGILKYKSVIGESARRADDQEFIGVERFALTHVDQQRRLCGAKACV